MAVTCTNDDKTVIINGNGDGTFSGSPTLFTITYPQGIVYSDFDGDGKKDLAVAAMDAFNTNGEVYLMLANNSGGFSAPTEFLTSNQTYTLIAGDLNGDSKMDLAVCDYIGSNNHIVFLMGNGLGSFGTAIPFAGATYTYSFAIGDFNQDTKTDLVAAYSEENNLAFMAGNGTGNFSTPGLLSTGAATTPYTVASADLNSDGKPDLISSNYASANISVLLNTGSGNFGSALNFATGNAPFHVASDDLNADGKPDLVVANNLSDNITVLINTSTIGIKDADALSQTVTVFPNPILSLLNLNVSNPLHNATVKCIDVTGKLVMEKNQLSGNSFRFDLSAVKAGMYFLQLYNNNELISTSKIFKAE